MDKKTYFELLDKLYAGKTSESENRLLASMTDRKYEAYFGEYSEQHWKSAAPEIDREKLDRMHANILGRIAVLEDFSKQRRRLWPTVGKVAAAVLLMLCAAVAGYRHAITAQPEQTFVVATGPGQKNSLQLPDGTRIWLNSGSQITYPSTFNSRNRTVQLEGEAYFSVARNEKLPFIVQTNGMSVTALGTKFNIKAYANEEVVTATLVEGKIRTDAGEESAVITPNNQVCYNRASGAMTTRRVDNMEHPMAWFHNKIFFNGQSLEQIAADLERIYNIQIVFADDNCRHHAYHGLVHNNSLHNLLDLISSTTPVDCRIKGDTVIFQTRHP